MAGIGFELKKMLRKGSFLMSAGGYFYATFISVGPLLICVGFLVVIRIILRGMGISIIDQNMLLSGITYAFMGSLFFSGMFGMILSRYVSDMIYSSREERIFPSFISSLAVCLALTGACTLAYLLIIDLPFLFEVLCYVLIMSLTTTFFVMVYVSAVKDYVRITLSFIFGVVLGYVIVLILIYILKVDTIYAILIGMDIGFTVAACMLTINIYKFFKDHDDSYFDFFKYIKKVPRLIWINTFYMVGIFGHSVMMWQTGLGLEVTKYMRVAPTYDVPAFYALLTVTPAMVIFVVKTETTFYDYYKEYMKMLDGGGTLIDLRQAGDNMRENMYNEILSLMQVQLMITVLCIVSGRFLFPLLGLSDLGFSIFGYMCIGYYCIVAANVISSIILYFDDRKSSFRIMAVFIVSHIVCVYISMQLEERLYGMGSTIAGIITLMYAFWALRKMVRSLDYRLYCSQPIGSTEDQPIQQEKS
jgi:polysaccharide biosynthesis protein PelG